MDSKNTYTVTGTEYGRGGTTYELYLQVQATNRVNATVNAYRTKVLALLDGEIANFYLRDAETGELWWGRSPIRNLSEAINFVRDDQRESNPDLSAREAVEAAKSTLCVPGLDDSDPDSFEAYRLVLMATEDEITAAFAKRY